MTSPSSTLAADDFEDLPAPDDPSPVSDPITLPATWCANPSALDEWGVDALVSALDRWDDLVPDEALFTFGGWCERHPTADLHILRTPFPGQPGVVAVFEQGPPPIVVSVSADAALYSPALEPDVDCDGQLDMETLLAHMAGRVMGLPIACPLDGGDCPRIELEALMVGSVPVCVARFPNAWDVERFNEAQGYEVPLP